MLLHYPVKVETPKMHTNTNSSFNVNYEIAVKCIKLHWQFHKKVFWWIIKINNHFTSCVQSVCNQQYTHISGGRTTGQSQRRQVCIKRFRRLSMSWIFVSYTYYCIASQGTRPWSISIKLRYIWCSFLRRYPAVISRFTFPVFQLLQTIDVVRHC